MNLRIVLTSAALCAACLIGTASASAQAAPAAGAAASAKFVGIINLRGAIGSTAEGKQASARIAIAVCSDVCRNRQPDQGDQ